MNKLCLTPSKVKIDIVSLSRLQKVDLVSFYFIFNLFSIFQFLELRVSDGHKSQDM